MKPATDDRLCRALLSELDKLRTAANVVSAAAPNIPDGRVYIAAALLVDVQKFAVRLKAGLEELQ